MNFAGLGRTVGHELIHGFDNDGGEYDKDGKVNNWWDPETKRKFLDKADCIDKQYRNYTLENFKLKVRQLQCII